MNKILILTLLLAVILAGCGKGEDRQAKYLDRAEKYFAEENYDKARIDASNVLQINPKNVAARQILGEVSFQKGDIRKAYGHFLSVIETEPENIAANISLAKIFVSVKDFDKALIHSNTVLSLDPDNAQVMGYKAYGLRGQGMVEEAEMLAEQSLALDASVIESLGILVQKYFEEKQPEKGLVILAEAQKLKPNNQIIALMKLSLLETMGRADDVEAELLRLSAEYPEEVKYATTLAKFYIRESKFDEAEAVLRTFASNNDEQVTPKLALISYLLRHQTKELAIKQTEEYLKGYPDESKFFIALAQLHLFTGDKDLAKDVLANAVEKDPLSVASIEARNMLVGIYLRDEDVSSANVVLKEIFEIEPENVLALLMRARILLTDGKLKAGIADLRVVLKNDPESVAALKMLVGAQELEGNLELALDNFKKLMSLEKPDLKTLAGAARIAIKVEQYQEAENYIHQALELDADNAGLVTNLIRLLVLKEDWEAASLFAKRLIDSEDSKALGYFLQAGLNLRAEEYDAATKNLKASIKNAPNAVESLTTLAQVLAEQKGVDIAIAYLDQHCNAYPKQAHCPHILGSLYAQSQQYDLAVVSLEKALSLNDKLVVTYKQLAKVFLVQRDLDNAENILRRGMEASGNDSLAFELANLYYQTKKYEKARDVYLSMIDKNEDALSAKNNLAMLYVEHLNTPENVKAANVLVAELKASDNPAYLDTVGWVLYLTGEYGQAVTFLQAAVDKLGSSGLLQYHLGMAYYKLGDSGSAKTHLELATKNKEVRYQGFDIAESTLAEL